MVVGHCVEELLRVQRTPKQQRQVAVCRLDDVGDRVHGLASVERVFVRQSILETIGKLHSRLECFGDPGQKRGVDDWRPSWTLGV